MKKGTAEWLSLGCISSGKDQSTLLRKSFKRGFWGFANSSAGVFSSSILPSARKITRVATSRAKMCIRDRNTPIQGTAADIIKIAMVRVYRRLQAEGLKSRLILQVHDELIVETTPDEIDTVKALVQQEMSGAAELSVPLVVDVGVGKTWYEAK